MNWQVWLVIGAIALAASYLVVRAVRRLRRERLRQAACGHCGLQRTDGHQSPAAR